MTLSCPFLSFLSFSVASLLSYFNDERVEGGREGAGKEREGKNVRKKEEGRREGGNRKIQMEREGARIGWREGVGGEKGWRNPPSHFATTCLLH